MPSPAPPTPDWQRILGPELRDGQQVASRTIACPAGIGKLTVVIHNYATARGDRRRVRRYPPPSQLDPRGQDRFRAVNLVLAGSARLADHLLRPGTVFLLDGPLAPDALQVDRHYADASLSFMDAFVHLIDDFACWPSSGRHWPMAPTGALIQGFARLHQQICNHALSDDAVLRAALAFMQRLLADSSARSEDDGFAARACRLLRDHPEPGFTVSEAARLLGMSPRAFRAGFRRSVGMAPGAYQMQERMNLACELLPEMGVQACAARLGYRDAAFFSRQFKRYVGTVPSTYLTRPAR
ncbi:MAG: helix-turn-helix transcriptional regulator [Planctomycetota bacterium]